MSGAKGKRVGFFLLPYGCFYALIQAAEDFEGDFEALQADGFFYPL